MKELSKETVTWLTIGDQAAGQRIDNFLLRELKGVPKSHIYRILRSGEVRVNSRRVEATHRLAAGDRVRLPPLRRPRPAAAQRTGRFAGRVLYEDEALLVVDKPAGIAVHGGSGVSYGLIEQLRQARPELRFLELVHRLDKETSGVLLLAKKRSALTRLHAMLREGRVEKHYLALVKGHWPHARQHVKLALHKFLTETGERRVRVSEEGQPAHTFFTLLRRWQDFSLVDAELKTGRTHQIRVHLAHLGHPIAGDDKYGNFALNKELARRGLRRMFLHAKSLAFAHPLTQDGMVFEAPLPVELQRFLAMLEGTHPQNRGADA
ncbi:RluA family pseudouridine synthase [Thiobacter aerophilum]|uniref:Pseudouridine synthase n=1 Tax=Thiobacter aerophilum TaxID=3121275 RepID=A0ABV0ECR7_9BURK